MGIQTADQLRSLNPNKLFNDLGGMRKKLKLETGMPSIEEVRSWIPA
jgi:lysyl-tRNA synthetase class 2